MQEFLSLFDPNRVADMLLGFVPRLAAALIVFLLFWLLVRLTRPTLRALLRRADIAETLTKLLIDNVYRFVILGLGLVMAASQLGINVGAALAGIGVAGIAVGFAAQDSIANSIAGFLIFWDKPFQVGDYVTTQGRYGVVRNITMRTTRIRTMENTYFVIPNRKVIEEPLVNHSMYGETRVNVPLGIAYKEKIPQAREVLLKAARSIEGVMEDPAPAVVVTELGNSSVNLEVRVWIGEAGDERRVFFGTLEACKLALDEAGIQIPFPHLQLFVDTVEDSVWEGAAALVGRGNGSRSRA